MILSPEDACNQALRSAGYPDPISDMYEGSRASRVAIEFYAQVRDALLRQHDWDFALGEESLSATVGGNLILGFSHEYNYPNDALRVRYVHAATPTPNNDPQPVRWVTGNDKTLGTKVIFTNQAAAVLTYIKRVTNPAQWSVAFGEALVEALAQRFSFALQNDINLSRTRADIGNIVIEKSAGVNDATPPAIPQMMPQQARQ